MLYVVAFLLGVAVGWALSRIPKRSGAGRYSVRLNGALRYVGDDASEAKRVLRAHPGARIFDGERDRTGR